MSKYKELCVYVGKRIAGSGKVYQVFELLPSRKEMLFTGIRGVYIGSTYKCQKTQISRSPERADREKEYNPKWEALDAEVAAHYARNRTEAAVKRISTPAIDAALEALKPLCKDIDYWQTKNLIEVLVAKATDIDKRRSKFKNFLPNGFRKK